MDLTINILLANNVVKFPFTVNAINPRNVVASCVWEGVSALGRGSTRAEPSELIVVIIAIGIAIVNLGVSVNRIAVGFDRDAAVLPISQVHARTQNHRH